MKREKATAGWMEHQFLFAAIMGLVAGGVCYALAGCGLPGVAIEGDPLQSRATYQSSWSVTWITFAISLMLVIVALSTAIHEWWIRFLFGMAAGFLLTGLWWQASHRIEITPTGFNVWSTNPFYCDRYELGKGQTVFEEVKQRPWSRSGNRHSLHYKYSDGKVVLLCRDTRLSPIWIYAAPHLVRNLKAEQLIGVNARPDRE